MSEATTDDKAPPKGICCPKCLGTAVRVLNTRPLAGGRTRRCRLCEPCNRRFYTVEVNNAKGSK